ncbi:transposase, Ptta/En/Spm [Tanacetum coccineum]
MTHWGAMGCKEKNQLGNLGLASCEEYIDELNQDMTMSSRKNKRARVRTRTTKDSQQVEDVLQMGSNRSDDEEVQVIQRKRVRGPTFMLKVWTKSDEDRISVSLNEYGQPIYKKQTLLDVLNDKFDLPMGCDDWILKSFGKKVRNWRARVKKDYYDPSLSYREQINSKPKRVRPVHWKKLVKTWNKENSKRVSEKNKANRAKKKMVQVTGKKSYALVREEVKESLGGRKPTRMELFRACFSTDGIAKNMEAANAIISVVDQRLEDQMEELSSQLPEGASDEQGPQDVYSKVMGKDNNGLADLYGLGVRASDVWGVVPSRTACRRDMLMYKSRCDQLSCELAQLKARDSHKQGSSENASFGTNVVRAKVYIKSIFNSTEIVAKGRIQSLDPNEIVGGEELGPNWCEVGVQVLIIRDEHLVRRYGLFVTIFDAIGATVAWPCPFVSVVREDDA